MRPVAMIVVVGALCAGCGAKKEQDPGKEKEDPQAKQEPPEEKKSDDTARPKLWELSERTFKIPYLTGELVVTGQLPTAGVQEEHATAIRIAMPREENRVTGGLEIVVNDGAKKAKEAAEDPDEEYVKMMDAKIVDPPRESAPGRWSRVYVEPMELASGSVWFQAVVLWEVGVATVKCTGRATAPAGSSAVWQQLLDVCKAVEVAVPAG